ASNRRLPEVDRMLYIVEKRSQRFARRFTIQAMAHAVSLPYQPNRLHQCLHIEHDIIAAGIKVFSQGIARTAGLARPPMLAPAPVRDGYDFVDGGMPGGDLGKA